MISKNQIKFVKSLQKKKFRLESKCFVVESTKNVNEILQSNYKVQQIYATESWIEKCKIKDDISINQVNENGGFLSEFWHDDVPLREEGIFF